MERNGRFRTTRWSLVLAARDRSDPGFREALAALAEAYWYPLYAFVRRQGHGRDEALDLTQGYFLRLLEKSFLDDVRPGEGRFRSFLLASMKHFLSHERERLRAAKRGGGRAVLSLDAEDAENRYRLEPRDDRNAETIYERRWALTVIDRALDRLEREMANEGKSSQLSVLRGFLPGEGIEVTYREAASALGTSEAAVGMAVLRLRRRLGSLLRDEVADTVRDPEQVEDEIRHLLRAVGES